MLTYLYVYVVLLICGGFIGFKKGSAVSLYAGIASGVLLLIFLQISKSNHSVGFIGSSVVCGLLCGSFLMRLIKTSKFMPSGMLLILSIIGLIASISILQKG